MPKLGRGITNDQARYLGALCREAHEPYSGRGLTRQEADLEIKRLLAKLAERNRRAEPA